jgi:single-strand DNA-binding protein
MSASLNKASLIGYLGNDPEMRYMPDGTPTATVSLATTSTWKDKNGDKKEKTDWHRIVFFKGLAEVAEKFLKKGSHVYIEGPIQHQQWEDKKDGSTRYGTIIVGREMKMLGKKDANQTETAPRNDAPLPADFPQSEDF